MKLILIKNTDKILKLKPYWNKLRNKVCPPRLRQNLLDEYSLYERMFNFIDDWFYNLKKEYKDYKSYKPKHIWHTYFDYSTGQNISSYADIRKIEKEKGLTYSNFKELDALSKKSNKDLKKKSLENSAKKLEGYFGQVRQGRSFYREHLDQGLYAPLPNTKPKKK